MEIKAVLSERWDVTFFSLAEKVAKARVSVEPERKKTYFEDFFSKKYLQSKTLFCLYTRL